MKTGTIEFNYLVQYILTYLLFTIANNIGFSAFSFTIEAQEDRFSSFILHVNVPLIVSSHCD